MSWYGYRYHRTLCTGQLHPITAYRTGSWVHDVLVLSVIMCPFTKSLIEFHFITIFIGIIVSIIVILMAILFILNYTVRLSERSSYSPNAQLPECFRPWTFSLNIGLNMLPSEWPISCSHPLLRYSTGEFQVSQLIFIAAFGAVYYPFASCMLVQLVEN